MARTEKLADLHRTAAKALLALAIEYTADDTDAEMASRYRSEASRHRAIVTLLEDEKGA